MSSFGLTADELAFLGANVGPADTVFEYGTGETTQFLALWCRYVTAVEHQAEFARAAMYEAAMAGRTNVSIWWIPTDFPYVEGTDDDGDLATFRRYIESCSGRYDVVLIDGRARCEAARWLAERAPFGPDPSMRFFLHDAERPQYAEVFQLFREEIRVGRLALLRMRTE